MKTHLHGWFVGTGIALGMVGAASAGGIDDALQDHFGSMVNTTAPQAYLDVTGGNFSGGSIVVRNRIVNPQWYSLQKPHLNFGCGGWDIFGGSFSFISSEQLIQMLRSIASSAVSYAFRLALETISDDIAGLLDRMEDKMHLKNWFGKSSCELGENLVESSGAGGPLRSIGQRLGSILNTGNGRKDDDSDGENAGATKSPATEAAETASEDEKKLVVKGNLVWRSMKEQQAETWGGVFGGTRFMTEMMSLTGTIIICIPDHDGCPYPDGTMTTYRELGQADLVVYTKGPTVGLKDLVEGTRGQSPVQLYTCLDGEDYCNNPQPLTQNNYQGAKARLLDILLGADRLGGLINKLAYPNVYPPPTDEEKRTIAALGGVLERVRVLAMKNRNAAIQYVIMISDALAAELVMQHVQSMMKVMSTAASKLENGAAGAQILALLGEANQAMHEDLLKIYSKDTVNTGQIAYYDMLMKNQRAVNVPGMQAN